MTLPSFWLLSTCIDVSGFDCHGVLTVYRVLILDSANNQHTEAECIYNTSYL